MGRTVNEMITSLPAPRRKRVERRSRELKAEVKGLKALRKVGGKSQADIAFALKVKERSVLQSEK